MSDFVPIPTSSEYVRRSVVPSSALWVIRAFKELLLTGVPGNILERILRLWQRRRIRRTPATHERGGRVTANDRELEFHPHSFEAVAVARYNAALERFGLGAYPERDSGLTK